MGDADVPLGTFALPDLKHEGGEVDRDLWMSREQFAHGKHTPPTVDMVEGRGSGFSGESRRASASSSAPRSWSPEPPDRHHAVR